MVKKIAPQEVLCCSSGEDNVSMIPMYKVYGPVVFSFILLLIGIILDHVVHETFFTGSIRFLWYASAYISVGLPVIKKGFESLFQKEFFSEFILMSVATVGAFAIQEYPEGVAVMLFYSAGELFQDAAVNKAKRSIKKLLDVRPLSASVLRDGIFQTLHPEQVKIGEVIEVKVGEKVPLDGFLISERGTFNTAALTGENKPKTMFQGDTLLAGMLSLDRVIEIKVTKEFADSALAKILEMVQEAAARKAKTEVVMRKFAKIYTPVVFFMALALLVVPYFFVNQYLFRDWLYSALIFLVISCPCALVISIPLGYFGGIGAASRHGILFKGAHYLDLMTKVNTMVMDKTGTLTQGVFKVQELYTKDIDPSELIGITAALEKKSTHAIAKAVVEYSKVDQTSYYVTDVEEMSGYGVKGRVNGFDVLAGNTKLMKRFDIDYPDVIDMIVETNVVVAIARRYAGHMMIADAIKEDAERALIGMKKQGITQLIMLSGDKHFITQKVAKTLGIQMAYGDLLPKDKVNYVAQLKLDRSRVLAFVGDGINDAPVLALSDVGIAMGGLGSAIAIETADVVIQTDEPSKIVTAITIAKATKKIVIQNIVLAFVIKALVLILGAGGIATIWEAVFADVGVALLAIMNAVRIQTKRFDALV